MIMTRKYKKHSGIDPDEFKALVINLEPTSLEQAQWMYSEEMRILNENPELMKKIRNWKDGSEEERIEAERIIKFILKQIRKNRWEDDNKKE